MPGTSINRPGAPTNPPHTAREGTDVSDYHPDPAVGPRDPTGARDRARKGAHGNAPPVRDHDPHPSGEGQPYAGDPNPVAKPLRYLDIEPNPAIHTGTPERKPDNADHGPKYAPS